MRTTLTLDPDLASGLREQMRRTGASWKDVVNQAIRAGLAGARLTPVPERYETPPVDPGPPALRGVPSVHEMLAYAEGEDYR